MKGWGVFLVLALVVGVQPAMAGKGKRAKGIFLRLDPGGHTAMIRDLFFFDHGSRLISASVDKTIRVWDLSELSHPRLVRTIRGEIGRGLFGMIYAIAVDPRGRFLAVGGIYGRFPKIRRLALPFGSMT